jgi:hypothetical protein
MCGQHREVKAGKFFQIIGLLIGVQWRPYQGVMCKPCAKAAFKRATLFTVTLGWLSIVSVLLVPFFAIYNIIRYIPFMSMNGKGTGPGPEAPEGLTPVVRDRLGRFEPEIREALRKGIPLDELCKEISDKAMVPEGDVRTYIEEGAGG